MKEVRIGVIGCGRIGRLHTTNLSRSVPEAVVAGVADPLVAKATWLDELGVYHRHEDYHSLLTQDDVDAVLVCSPTDTHSKIVTEAAAAGKAIFCEKPLDLTMPRARAVIDEARKAEVLIQVGFNRRFDHNFAEIRKRVSEGEVGDVHLVKITSRDPQIAPIEYLEVSGGIFVDMMIHDFDMAEFVSGSPVEKVMAAGAVLIDPSVSGIGDVDTAVVTLWFENGALGVIDNSRQAAYGYDQRVEVFGSKGMVQAENDTPDHVRRFTADSESRSTPLWFFLERYNQAYIDEIRTFVDMVQDGASLSPEAGLRPLAVGLAATKSLAEARPVAVSEVLG